MNEQTKLWLDKEMNEMQKEIHKLNQRLMKKVPLWIALCIVVMVGIGILAGYDFSYIIRVHFLIGCFFAFFIWLCFYLQTKTTSIKKVRSVYEKAIENTLTDKEEIDLFNNQMEKGSYDVRTFQNPTTDKYPARFLVGEDFWVYYRYPYCTIIRACDVEEINIKNETTRINYNVGNARVRQTISVGIFFNISYSTEKEDSTIWLANIEQVEEAKKLIQKYEKGNSNLFS